jgi:hypothetical protein
VAIRARDTPDPATALSAALRRAIDDAHARLREATTRRRELELQLRSARAVEHAARQNLDALRGIGREAADELRHDLNHHGSVSASEPKLLSGGELRETIARVALRQTGGGDALHWREWLGLLRDAGFDAAGKNPEATFQTQLARSPLTRRTHQDGVYVLDLTQVRVVRDQLLRQGEQLARLPPSGQLALMGDVRAQRQELQNAIARAERALEEMWRVLALERPPGWAEEADVDQQELVEAWMAVADRGADTHAETLRGRQAEN